jgi:hypothetical protein
MVTNDTIVADDIGVTNDIGITGVIGVIDELSKLFLIKMFRKVTKKKKKLKNQLFG